MELQVFDTEGSQRMYVECYKKVQSLSQGIKLITVSKNVEAVVARRSSDGLAAENERLGQGLKERAAEVGILQDALGFPVRRQKR